MYETSVLLFFVFLFGPMPLTKAFFSNFLAWAVSDHQPVPVLGLYSPKKKTNSRQRFSMST